MSRQFQIMLSGSDAAVVKCSENGYYAVVLPYGEFPAQHWNIRIFDGMNHDYTAKYHTLEEGIDDSLRLLAKHCHEIK